MTVRTARAPRVVHALTALLAGVGCSASDSSIDEDGLNGSESTTRDSAGITIVESAEPALTEPWVVDDSALFRIGGLSGVPEYELYNVRGALRLSDGRLVVANAGTYELRWYSEAGEYLFSVGAQGEGPGDFERIGNLFWVPGDTVATYDTRLRRVSEFGPDGAFARTTRIDPSRFENRGVFTEAITRLSNGDFLVVSGGGGSGLVVSMAPDEADGADRSRMEVYGVDDATTPVSPIVTLPGRDVVSVQIEGMGPSAILYEFTMPLPRFALGAAHGLRWVIANNERPELLVWDGAGVQELIVRPSIEPRPVTSADRGSALEALDDVIPPDPRAREMLSDLAETHMDGLASLPFFSDLILDAEGNIWARDYVVPGSEDNVWTVFEASGIWLGSVTFPPDLDVLSIGSDYVVGLTRNELDVEIVSVHGLTKP